MVCESIGCPHPEKLPLTPEQLTDWHAYYLVKNESDEVSEADKIEALKNFEAEYC